MPYFLLACSPGAAGQHASSRRRLVSPRRRPTRREPQAIPRRVAIRFLTDSDYPPFNYYDEDNVLTGFNVDIARAVCLELAAACDIQVRPWPELLTALRRGEADAVIASHAISASALRMVDFTDRYYHTPARFAGKRNAGRLDATPEGLEGKKIAVTKGTRARGLPAHLLPRQPDPRLRHTRAGARRADRRRRRSAVRRRHQPSLLAQRHRFQGLLRVQGRAVRRAQVLRRWGGIAVSREDPQLKGLINAALRRMRESGRYEELVLRYFPLRAF